MFHRTTLIEFITLFAKNIATFKIQGRTKVLEFSLTSSVCNVLLVINPTESTTSRSTLECNSVTNPCVQPIDFEFVKLDE